MPLDLRPLTLGELLDRSFSLFRHHFWLFVGIMALPSLVALAFGLVVAIFSPRPGVDGLGVEPTPENALHTLVTMVILVGAMAGMGAVYFVAYAVALGATTVAVSQLYMDRPTSIRAAYEPLRGKVWRMALLLLLITLRLFAVMLASFLFIGVFTAVGAAVSPVLGGMVAILGGLIVVALCSWMALRYAVAVPVAVLEDETSTEAIRRSITLTKGSLGRVFVLLAFTMVITYAVLLIFQGPFLFVGMMAGPESTTFFWTNLFGTISGAVGGAFTSPLMIVAFAVLYYDLRTRREGFDLEMMLARLDRPGDTDAPTGLSPSLPQ